MKKIVCGVIGVLLVISIVATIYCFNSNKKVYELTIDNIEKIDSVTLGQNATSVIITEEYISEIVNCIGNRTTTKKNSKKLETEGMIDINIEYVDGNATTIYVYKEKDKYYIEELNNGKYEITEEEYNAIKGYIK